MDLILILSYLRKIIIIIKNWISIVMNCTFFLIMLSSICEKIHDDNFSISTHVQSLSLKFGTNALTLSIVEGVCGLGLFSILGVFRIIV